MAWPAAAGAVRGVRRRHAGAARPAPGGGLIKIGFHAYRHSIGSNLAAAGVDQRVIDELMGHTTEAMRTRYRHLAPRAKRSAIEPLAFAPGRRGPAA